MKILLAVLAFIGAVTTKPVYGSSPAATQVSSVDTPMITFARGRIVKVKVPAGYDSVTLQRRTVRRSQPWVAMGTKALAGGGEEVLFRLRSPLPARMMRVVGHRATAVAEGAGAGISEFFADPATSGGAADPRANANFTSGVSLTSVASNATSSLSLGDGVAAPARDVVESDIWKVQGNRVYVFNPYRGLQVIDISDPKAPGLLGTLYLPSAGDELYLLGESHAVLLVRSSGNFTWSDGPLGSENASVVVCDVRDGTPEVVARVPIEGNVVESRLVGTALYVATEVYSVGEVYRNDIRVTGYDLSDPANPVIRGAVTIPKPTENEWSYLGSVQASEKYFLVASRVYPWSPGGWSNPYRTDVSVVDITAPDGTVKLRGGVSVEGHVTDKFKMHTNGDLLTIISDVWNPTGTGPRRYTHVENFDLSKKAPIRSLGKLDLGLNETVQGTRFDDSRIYVVTFEQIDPLWVVDNSKPSEPVVTGHLEVPGFSTFIEPMGDRLVTVGFVNRRVTVSLFDVADPKNPKTLKQLQVSEQWGNSEAAWDEKAFTVLKDEGLIMLPVNEWSSRWVNYTGQVGGVQLVDLKDDTLTLRGRIQHNFVPRRSTLHRDTVLALGNTSLLAVKIEDRDKPEVVSDLQLAWRTSFVWQVGKHLLQIGGGVDDSKNVISVSPTDTPDDTLSSLAIGDEPILVADHRDGYLYVAQRKSPTLEKNEKGTLEYTQHPIKLSIFSTESLPALVKVSETSFQDVPGFTYGNYKALWPAPGTFVISVVDGYNSRFIILPYAFNTFDLTVAPSVISGDSMGITRGNAQTFSTNAITSNLIAGDGGCCFPYYTDARHHLIALDVRNPKSPKYLGTESSKPGLSASFSESFSANGKIYTSYQFGWAQRILYVVTLNKPAAAAGENQNHEESLLGRHFLKVVDYTDTANIAVKDNVSAPGVLSGLTRDGTVVYTTGPHYKENGYPVYSDQKLHASTFDGEKLHLAATYGLSNYGMEVIPMGDRLFVFPTKPSPQHENKLARFAQLIELGSDTEFTLLGEAIYGGWSARAFDGLLLGSTYGGNGYFISALDFTVPSELRSVGNYGVGWLWLDFSKASGNAASGFYFPAGPHGVLHVEPPPR